MTRYDRLIERAQEGSRILIDGATGSECLRRGAPALDNGWSGGAVLSHPDVVHEVHRDYLRLGAELIASNTFATGRNVLRDAGVVDSFEEVNRRAVEIAVSARDSSPDFDRAVVAAGISNWSFSGDRPSLDELRANTVEQATIMRDAGAELISLEMMVDLPRLEATLDAVASVGLPVWVGFSIGPEEGQDPAELPEPVPLREGGLLADAVVMARAHDEVDAMCLMHSDVRLTERGVATIRDRWSGPIGAYAHAAQMLDDELTFVDVITPDDYAAYQPSWHQAGATIVGGCCGIGPAHIAAVARSIGR